MVSETPSWPPRRVDVRTVLFCQIKKYPAGWSVLHEFQLSISFWIKKILFSRIQVPPKKSAHPLFFQAHRPVRQVDNHITLDKAHIHVRNRCALPPLPSVRRHLFIAVSPIHRITESDYVQLCTNALPTRVSDGHAEMCSLQSPHPFIHCIPDYYDLHSSLRHRWRCYEVNPDVLKRTRLP